MTIKDIAKESGYGVGTVSRVLNNSPGVSEKARRRILEVVEKHHFRLNNAAKLLKQQTNNDVAIIVKGTKNLLFASLLVTLQRQIRESGYTSVIYYITEDEHEVEQAIQASIERSPLGILFLGSNKENFRELFSYVDVPCVLVTNSADDLEFDNLSSVAVDDCQAAFCAVEYLISLGHERIGILGGEMEHSNPAKSRYKGCLEAFEKHGICFDPATHYANSYFTVEGGYHAMTKLLNQSKDLTAVFAMSDVTAIGAIRAAKDQGYRVPEDISVIGYDGIEMGQYMVPKLTTISQPGEQIAQMCITLLLQAIGKEKTAVRMTVPFELNVGESTIEIRK